MTEHGATDAAATGGCGILYLVATPIGNLDDMGLRAVETLRAVDLIAAEDTRHSGALLARYGVGTALVSLHEHNETRASGLIHAHLQAGRSVALISDAGTPLISDPGQPLVRTARDNGIRVVPIPGPCAAIAALSASGLAVDRFAFEGFPPRTSGTRRRLFESLLQEQRTLIFYESSHRVRDTIRDMAQVFEPARRIVIARELTKLHETITGSSLGSADAMFNDPNMLKGEFVIVLQGACTQKPTQDLTAEHERILKLLLEECSVKTASTLAARITGTRREIFYRKALQLLHSAGTTDD